MIDVYLYKLGHKYVGFISCTNHPFTFMKKGIKRNFILLLLLVGISISLKPSRLKLLPKMKNEVNLKGLKKQTGENIGRFMSFGVLKEYRRYVDNYKKLTIPNVLMREVFSHFSKMKKKCFFLSVLKINKAAIKLYQKYNGVALSNNDGKSDIFKFYLSVTQE